jgi:hypothetical protein
MRILRALGLVIVGMAAVVALLFVAARFHDGPLAMIPGGPLTAGTLVTDPVQDWRFAADEDTIELQLADEDTSRTVWILVNEGLAFIPCSLGFPPGKRWHRRADQDGRALLRIQGKRYPVTLQRTGDVELKAALLSIIDSKYGGGPPGDAGIWFFAVTSRSP